MASSACQISCYVFPGGHLRSERGMLLIRGRRFPCQRIGAKISKKWLPSVLRCSEEPVGSNSDNKRKVENVTHVDENTLEAKLREAIHSEDYAKAADVRDKLKALQDDNMAGVRAANAKFYKAFETGDMKMMRQIWIEGESAHCVHPGAGRVSGYDMVIASWELMLGPETFLPLKIELHNLDLHVKGNMGFVTCLEVVRTSGSSWGKQLATNIFEKRNGVWYLSMHHASHITI